MPWAGISWGGFTNHLRIGIDVGWDDYNTWTPSINVYVAYYVGVDSSWDFADSQTLNVGGNVSGSHTFHNGMGKNGVMHIVTHTIHGQGQSYGGGPDYWFDGSLAGVYLGAGPTHGRGFRLPARPIRPPSAPGAPVASSVKANGATFGWSSPADHGGSTVNWTWLELATANYSNVIYSNQLNQWTGRTLTNLAPNSTYYMRDAAGNAAGWSPWSAISSFSTLPFQVAKPTLTNVLPDSATVNWVAPAGGTPTGWEMQVSRNAQFTDLAQSLSGASWATSRAVTGLTPATNYFYRVRANTAYGFGAWSAAQTAQTLSGAKARINGQWVNGTAYVRQSGGWVLAKVNKRDAGAWEL